MRAYSIWNSETKGYVTNCGVYGNSLNITYFEKRDEANFHLNARYKNLNQYSVKTIHIDKDKKDAN